MPDTILSFRGIALDLARGELRIGGSPVELQSLTFRLIRYLALNRERTVSADELREEIWQGTHVSEAALHQALRQARLVVYAGTGERFVLVEKLAARSHIRSSKPTSRLGTCAKSARPSRRWM